MSSIQLGDLTVRSRTARLNKTGTFWFGGRMVRGLIGKDVLADSLIVHVDRDRGRLYLATQGHLPPPPAATEIKLRREKGRFMASVRVNKTRSVELHMDLGAPFSMIWNELIDQMKLPRMRVRTTLLDEYGTQRTVETGGLAAKLEVGGTEQDGLMLLPFGDRRLRQNELDGALGQNYLSSFLVTINWHNKRAWLKPRVADLGELARERVMRWSASYEKCQTLACVTVTINRPEPPPQEPPPAEGAEGGAGAEGAPAEPAPIMKPAPVAPTTISFVREAWTKDHDADVTFEAVNADGQPLGLPLLRVTFPTGQDTIVAHQGVDVYLAAASLRVVDMSPFPRPCENENGPGATICYWQVQRMR